MFSGAFDSDEGWSFERRPITDTSNEAVIAEILVEDSRGVFRGQVGKECIYEGACVYRFGVVPGRFIVPGRFSYDPLLMLNPLQ